MFYEISKTIWLIAAPTNALIIVMTFATLWALLRRSKLAAWIAVAGAFGLMIAGFTPLGYWLTLPLENRFPRWQADPRAAPHGIIVLGGESGERITVLAELSRRFPQAQLVYSGPGDGNPSVRDLLNRFARLGQDPARITMERRSRNTFENAAYSQELIKPNSNQRWLLVTSAIHMPRAIGCFRKVGFVVDAHPTQFTSGYQSYLHFVSNTGSRALSRLDVAAKEWIGLATYRLMGKTGALFPAP